MVGSSIWHNMDGSPIIVTENVIEYRKTISEYVNPDDIVLEVGCAEGLTTALISQKAKQAFGIDKSKSQTAKAVSRHQHIPNLKFRQVDAWDMTAVRQLSDEYGVENFNVIYIDVSGSRKVGDVESLLGKYEHVFNPRCFIVKAYQLKRLVTRCKLFALAQQCKPPLPAQGQPTNAAEESALAAGQPGVAADTIAVSCGAVPEAAVGEAMPLQEDNGHHARAATADQPHSSLLKVLR